MSLVVLLFIDKMFVVIAHMRYAGAFSAVSTDVAFSLQEAEKKAFDILLEYYNQYCEDEGEMEGFNIRPLSDSDMGLLMMESIAQYTYNGGYGEIVTISEV